MVEGLAEADHSSTVQVVGAVTTVDVMGGLGCTVRLPTLEEEWVQGVEGDRVTGVAAVEGKGRAQDQVAGKGSDLDRGPAQATEHWQVGAGTGVGVTLAVVTAPV